MNCASFTDMFDPNAEMHESHDAVSEVLLGMRLRGANYWRLRLTPPFGVNFTASDDPSDTVRAARRGARFRPLYA